MKKVLSKTAILLIKFYRACISPYKPSSCRFYPSCSQYAMEAFEKHYPLRAFLLTLKRLLRCHPFCEGGYDPVP